MVVGKDKPSFHASHRMTAIAVLDMQQLAENVQGIRVPNSGHFIAEEQPQFVINQLSNFFARNTTTTGTG
jgi:pimeloyl-ACP methyl ester carboxylesterase